MHKNFLSCLITYTCCGTLLWMTTLTIFNVPSKIVITWQSVINRTRRQRISTKGRIAGDDFYEGQCNVTPSSLAHCTWLSQSSSRRYWFFLLCKVPLHWLPMLFNEPGNPKIHPSYRESRLHLILGSLGSQSYQHFYRFSRFAGLTNVTNVHTETMPYSVAIVAHLTIRPNNTPYDINVHGNVDINNVILTSAHGSVFYSSFKIRTPTERWLQIA